MSTDLKTYLAVYPEAGHLRRLWFEAPDETAARLFCARVGAGLQGEESREPGVGPATCYDEETARRLLGNISPSTLYRELSVGNLERIPGIRKVLVTRESVEKWRR